MSVADAAARTRAIDPLISCCVSAPAGSGKTELLIQRALALLARVRDPEQVVAITFTRKAAAEIRARLLQALTAAQSATPVLSAHQERTRALAEAVLERDRARDWQLLSTPSRLRILTIDSFCGELTRQMPLLSGCGGEMRRRDDASALYRAAVNSLMTRLQDPDEGGGEDLRRLLLHLDNDWESAAGLLEALLARRDQWLPLLGAGGLDSDAFGRFQAVVDRLWSAVLADVQAFLSPCSREVLELLAAQQETLGLPETDCERVRARRLADLLLTQKHEWRKTVNKRDGFPSDDAPAKARRQRMIDLLESLAGAANAEEGRALLRRVRQMPDPAQDPGHWQALASLTRVLPRLVAELLLVFRQAGEVDHGQIALAALDALGEDEEPSELALRLDHRIEHLLVDEFQDTSSGQYELIRRLTRGWAEHNAQDPDAPRTLMLVGDAMQSIYGFRDANVGLFIRAREQGIGDLLLEPLSLQVNFRSQAGVVDWVNAIFQGAFPDVDDARVGAVRYRPALAQLPATGEPSLALFEGEEGAAAELDWLLQAISAGVADESVRSIAVLGRSRRLLRPLLARLRAAGIAFHGRDLDPLDERMVISDLLVLCRVLSDHYDRYAWLCLLRAPWGGLDHQELLQVARALPVPALLLQQAALPEEFSAALKARLERLRAVLDWAEHYRDRASLRTWVEEVWLRLGAAATLRGAGDVEDAQQFFRCVEELEQAGEGLRIAALEERVERLFAAGASADCKVEVMTLHRAKGLEFDWVFIPSLHGGTAGGQQELLLWDEFTEADGTPAFLFDLRSSRDAAEGQRIYDLLRARQKEKQALEITRLLYVGCTRAAQRLFLSGCVTRDARSNAPSAPAGSLLNTLLPALRDVPEPLARATPAAAAPPQQALEYRRLSTLPELEILPAPSRSSAPELPQNRHARAYGTALHRCMESLLLRTRLPDGCDAPLTALLRSELFQAGCEPEALDSLCERGTRALERTLKDERSRWMLSSERAQRAAELPVTVHADDEFRQLVIDYCFLDAERSERWIIDYKTSVPEPGEEPEVFYQRELERYREQLGAYRQALRALYPEPVRCALQFLDLGEVRELSFPS